MFDIYILDPNICGYSISAIIPNPGSSIAVVVLERERGRFMVALRGQGEARGSKEEPGAW